MSNVEDTWSGQDESDSCAALGSASAAATSSLLHHGLSQTLIGAFDALAEQIQADGRPRFPERTVRELRRLVLCRSYAGACLELGWWLWTLWRGGGSDAPLRAVYLDGLVNSRQVHAALAARRLRLPDEARIDGSSCEVEAGSERFVLHLGRLPLWCALLELLVFIDPRLLRPVEEAEPPGKVANRLQRTLYAFLGEHAQPLQQQRRLAAMLEWLGQQSPESPGDAIDDRHILDFWLNPPQGAQDVVRFRTVAEAFFCLREALHAGARAHAAGQAIAFETLEDVLLVGEDVEIWLDSDSLNLAALCAPPRFLTARAAQSLEALARFPDAVGRLPLTLARWHVWGHLQGRWLEAVKRRQAFDPHSTGFDDYADWCTELVAWRDELAHMAEAGLAVLLKLGETTEVLGQLVEVEPQLADTICGRHDLTDGIEPARLAALRLQLPALNQALQRIERALKSTTRAGFKGTEDYADAQAYQDGTLALRALDGRIRRLLVSAPQWSGNFAADRSIVLQRLTALHAGDAPRHEHTA